jgi:hypothetical protein
MATVAHDKAGNPDYVNEKCGNLEYAESDQANDEWQRHTLAYGQRPESEAPDR